MLASLIIPKLTTVGLRQSCSWYNQLLAVLPKYACVNWQTDKTTKTRQKIAQKCHNVSVVNAGIAEKYSNQYVCSLPVKKNIHILLPPKFSLVQRPREMAGKFNLAPDPFGSLCPQYARNYAILVPIALYASLIRRGLGTRNARLVPRSQLAKRSENGYGDENSNYAH